MAVKCGIFKTTYRDDEAIWQTKVSKFWLALLLIGLLAFPFAFQGSRYLLYVINSVFIAVIAAVGLNILTGFTGQISLGHGAFMGVGAYASGYFMTALGMPFLACVVAAGCVTAVVGMIFGIPSLRLKGLYLAIATLAAQVILEFVFVRWRGVTGGSQGMLVPPASIGGLTFNSDFKFYFLALAFTILTVMIAKNIVRTKPGRAFMAIRDRYISAEIIGVPLFQYKLISFGISSFYAGVAGSLWGHYIGIITPEHFNVMISIQYLSMIIIGGLGSIHGTIMGAVFMTLLPEVLRLISGLFSGQYPVLVNIFGAIRESVFGLVIILFLIFEPDGLAARWKTIQNYWKLWPFSY
ncbi:MAG: branched-chain amino acid ABC transporter permease [Syntrophales bacterium]